MKKLIIVDTDDEKYTHAKVSLAYKDDEGMWADVNYETLPLRPMPMKKASLNTWFAFDKPVMYTYNPNDYDKGWNDCVDFLEGEEYDGHNH